MISIFISSMIILISIFKSIYLTYHTQAFYAYFYDGDGVDLLNYPCGVNVIDFFCEKFWMFSNDDVYDANAYSYALTYVNS